MTTATKGSCLCGKLTYEFIGAPLTTVSTTLALPHFLPSLLSSGNTSDDVNGPRILTRPLSPVCQGICHCTTCRKLTGSTYLTFLTVPDKNFAFTSTQPQTYNFTHPAGPPMRVSSCSDCGVAVCKAVEGEGNTIVLAGTLDDGGVAMDTQPQVELWTKERVGWCGEVGTGAMVQFEGFPPPASSAST